MAGTVLVDAQALGELTEPPIGIAASDNIEVTASSAGAIEQFNQPSWDRVALQMPGVSRVDAAAEPVAWANIGDVYPMMRRFSREWC